MAQQPFMAVVLGIPHVPAVKEVNIRSGPHTSNSLLFRATVGLSGIRVMSVALDTNGDNYNGKVYHWLQLQFPDGSLGWGRDDLISVYGDGSQLGYPVVAQPTQAFALTRSNASAVPQVVQPQVVQPAQPQGGFTPRVVQPQVVQPQVFTPNVVQPQGFTPNVVQPTQPQVVQPQVVQPATQVIQPVQVTQMVVVQPAAPVPAAAPASRMTGTAMAQGMNRAGSKMRSGPGVNNGQVGTLGYKEMATILEVGNDQSNNGFKWIRIRATSGAEGWTREDNLRLSGDVSPFGYPTDLYPNPAVESSWVRGWDPTGSLYSTGKHDGWDHAGAIGAALYAGPFGGVVMRDAYCAKCGDAGTSAVDAGYPLGDSRVLSDQAWNFGYGHFIITRYDNSILPNTTKNLLASKGWSGMHAFVMFAHLNKIIIKGGTSVTAGQEIAKLGNSGQSTGAHLHLELRFGADPNAQWATMKPQLVSPDYLYYR